MTAYACDLAVSAVASDAGLVAELTTELATRVHTVPASHREPTRADGALEPLLRAEQSRVALVLHQELWRHDARTLGDATELRTRLASRRGSVCVMTLDDSPVESWLACAPRYDLGTSGRAGAIEFVVGVVAAAGGAVTPMPQSSLPGETAARWSEPTTAFLAQARAHSALRHELDAIVAALKAEIERARAERPERRFDLHVHPQRVVVRLDDAAISFSWVPGRLPSVSDGRLLVIAWHGVTSGARGFEALKSATPLRERIYAADGSTPEEWRWRAEDPARQPYLSGQLVADWLARASIARTG